MLCALHAFPIVYRMSDPEKLSERLQIVISPSEVKAIDDWRFANRKGSRSEAIRDLIRLGLVAANAPSTSTESLPPPAPPAAPAPKSPKPKARR